MFQKIWIQKCTEYILVLKTLQFYSWGTAAWSGIKLEHKWQKEYPSCDGMDCVDDWWGKSAFFNAIELTTLVLYHIPILIGISAGRNKIGISRKRAHSQSTHYAYVGLHGWGRNWKAFYKKLLPNLFVIQLFSHKTRFFFVLKWVGNKIGEILKEWEVVKENHWLQ